MNVAAHFSIQQVRDPEPLRGTPASGGTLPYSGVPAGRAACTDRLRAQTWNSDAGILHHGVVNSALRHCQRLADTFWFSSFMRRFAAIILLAVVAPFWSAVAGSA